MINLKQTAERAIFDDVLTAERVDSLFGFAYKRCFNKEEAQDLCQEIIAEILKALKKDVEVDSIDAYIWRIAHNTYCDYVNRQNKRQAESTIEHNGLYDSGFEDRVLAKLLDAQQLARIKREIAFMGRIYREVMVMFYLEEMPISDIAMRLDVPVNRVKQRLFSAREKIRKEVSGMEAISKTLKPSYLWFIGSGNFKNGDPRREANRLLSQNVLISCRRQAKCCEELSKELDIPTAFMEDELAILENAKCIRRTAQGKYLADFIIIDRQVQHQISAKHSEFVGELTQCVKSYVKRQQSDIMNVGYLYSPDSVEFILWSLIPRFADVYTDRIAKTVCIKLADKGICEEERDWILFGNVVDPNLANDEISSFYGWDGTGINSFNGYKNIYVENLYGKRLPRRFDCFSNLANNPTFLMIFKCINGLDINSLNEDDKEAAAKALESKLIQKHNGRLYPNILLFDKKSKGKFNAIVANIEAELTFVSDELVSKYIQLILEHVPPHVLGQAKSFIELTDVMRHMLVEQCIIEGLLYVPDSKHCGEGMWATVEE